MWSCSYLNKELEMKKILLVLAAASAFVFGGGDVAPVEPAVVTPAPVPEVSSPIKFYIGGGYAAIDADGSGVGEQQYEDDYGYPGLPHSYNIDANNYLLLAGVKINKYFAIEGRYWNSIDDFDYKYTSDGSTNQALSMTAKLKATVYMLSQCTL
jgi:hypothetical protein